MNLNTQQLEAVNHLYNPVLVLAGAGSGKTGVIINRIAKLIRDHKVDPSSILAVTFTNKAASELKNRLYKMVGMDAKFISCGTFHSISLSILREFKERAGFTSNFTIYDSDDKVRVIKQALKDLQLNDKIYKPKSIANMISRLKNQLIYPDHFTPKSDDLREYQLKEIYKKYQEILDDSNGCDFDDIISKTVLMLQRCEDISFDIQNRYQFIHVDEYQDTNHSQELLIEEFSRTFNNIFVVGDEDQAIYSWRGADLSYILNFQEKYHDAKVIRLEQNYRSTKNILSGANDVIKDNRERLGKTLFTEHGEGEMIKLKLFDYDTEEADDLLKLINDLDDKGYPYRDTAILYRVNSLSRVIEDRLRRGSIPYKIVGGVKFYERKEIKDITAYLNLLINPNDNLSFERVVNFPPRGIGKEGLKKIKLYSLKEGKTYLQTIRDDSFLDNLSKRARNGLESFGKLLDKFGAQLNTKDSYEIANGIFEDSGIATYYSKEDDEGLERHQNLEQFIAGVEEYCETNENSALIDFLHSVSLLSDIDKFNESDDSITLMSVHSSKGLEFKNIIICGANEGIFPSFRSLQDGNIEEERRLFYVAMTRAMENLFIYSYKFSRFGATFEASPPSRFITNLKDDYSDFSEFNRGERSIKVKRKRKERTKEVEKVTFAKDQWVTHDQFGDGKILLVEEHRSGVAYVVDFEDFGPKKLLAKYAKLRKLNFE